MGQGGIALMGATGNILPYSMLERCVSMVHVGMTHISAI
jgi:hypothetical protein